MENDLRRHVLTCLTCKRNFCDPSIWEPGLDDDCIESKALGPDYECV